MSGPCGYDRNTLKKHFVYVAYDSDGEVIYVGRTSDLNRRMWEHSRTSEWWDLLCNLTAQMVPTLNDANKLEQEIIRGMRPKFNNDYVPRDGQ